MVLIIRSSVEIDFDLVSTHFMFCLASCNFVYLSRSLLLVFPVCLYFMFDNLIINEGLLWSTYRE